MIFVALRQMGSGIEFRGWGVDRGRYCGAREGRDTDSVFLGGCRFAVDPGPLFT
ncbi:hypothetical protein BDV95DRAFT_559684 [Massariosphaeria phaeospora]|uniref:Uncharacterized protein n=1 Tax=Massariosphaeria phaeospora TaxID=100035 RepID=A0A7C8IEH6_9PLEO|nr:hypothetical protein BDV95DRAFT_559684 [Massariosphaeria phaeospora]